MPQRLEDRVELLVVAAKLRLCLPFEVLEASFDLRVDAAARRSSTKARMIAMFTATARLLRRTLDSIATPCSVNTYGA